MRSNIQEKHILDNHLKRKTPCVSIIEEQKKNNDIDSKEMLEIEKLKIKLEIENAKLLTKEKDLENKKELLLLKSQIDQEAISLKSEKDFEIKKELILLKNDKMLERGLQIEKTKTERKEKTTNMINSQNKITNITNITNNVINHISEKYKDNLSVNHLPLIYDHKYNELAYPEFTRPGQNIKKIYDKSEKFQKNILEYYFKEPDDQCLFYIEEIEKFFGLYKDQERNIEVKEVEFKEEILPELKDNMLKALQYIYDNIRKYKKIDSHDEKYLNLYANISAIIKGYCSAEHLLKTLFTVPSDEYK